MKNIKLSELNCNPEDFGVDYIPSYIDTDMTLNERHFVSGLIKLFAPCQILEIGVAGGGNTVNILHTIKDMESSLTSIDIAEIFNHPFVGPLEVGGFVKQEFDYLSSNKWQLLTGKDPAERMEDLNRKFDMVIIDTAHVHPIETLNFLSVLPFLNENAVVILHDVSLFMDTVKKYNEVSCIATRVLMSCVCADKYSPEFKGFGGYTNIVAFQISEDTRKYIRNVFDSLMIPWECRDWTPFCATTVKPLIARYYSKELNEIFDTAVKMNLEIEYNMHNSKFHDFTNKLYSDKSVVFYGAGDQFKILSRKKYLEKFKEVSVWDKKAEEIKQVDNYIVSLPDYSTIRDGYDMIVTIENNDIFEEIKNQFSPLGYNVYHGLFEYAYALYEKRC